MGLVVGVCCVNYFVCLRFVWVFLKCFGVLCWCMLIVLLFSGSLIVLILFMFVSFVDLFCGFVLLYCCWLCTVYLVLSLWLYMRSCVCFVLY